MIREPGIRSSRRDAREVIAQPSRPTVLLRNGKHLHEDGLPDEVPAALARRYADVFRVLLTDRERQPKPAFDDVVKVLKAKV